MKEGFRQCMAWLHTWSGLVVGWVLFFVFVTGTAGYFNTEITRWMQPEVRVAAAVATPDTPTLLDMALTRLQQQAPSAEFWSITLPHESLALRGWQDLSISWETLPQEGHEHGVFYSETLDSRTGELLHTPEARKTNGGYQLYRMHYELHYMPYEWGIRIVGICTMLMLLAVVSGVITHKKIFKDFFTFRPGKGQRSWLDAHNALSVMVLPFFLMITYSGLLFFTTVYMPAGVAAFYGTDDRAVERFYDELYPEDGAHQQVALPPAPLAEMVATAERQWGVGEAVQVTIEHHAGHPAVVEIGQKRGGRVQFYETPALRFDAQTGALLGDADHNSMTVRTGEAFFALHEGRFAGLWLRWVYFVSGVLGCAVIATGLLLWAVKRRKDHEARPGNAHFGLRLVEALNLGTVVGLLVAVAAYFWANRLLPLGLADRAAWEVHWMFIVWAELLVYAFWRNSLRAWVEMLWLAVAAYGLLPLLNALTTDRHLGVSLPAGDWTMAGFDLTMLLLAALLAYCALKMQRRLPAAVSVPAGVPAEGRA